MLHENLGEANRKHAFQLLALAYLLFMKKYYHLHEEYLASLEK